MGCCRFGVVAAALVMGCDTGATVDGGLEPDTSFDASGLDVAVPPDVASDAERTCVDDDDDGHDALACGGDDCDDADPDRFPDNPEICDALDHDEDCDPTTVSDRDRDGDGHSDAACCNVASDGTRTCGGDCDDFSLSVRPGAREVCNEIDEDCDGNIDEGVARTFHRDADRDGFGCTCADAVTACSAPPGYVEDESDCDDTLAAYHPGANGTCGLCPAPYRRLETCDGLDDDCSGIVDDDAAADACAIANGTGTCSGGACTFVSCNPGHHRCGATCVASTSPAGCGTSCTPCPAPSLSTATCDGFVCGFTCAAGTSLVGGACDPRAPRPLAPASSATVTSARPTFRWVLVSGTNGARVEVCRDRGCATVVATIDASGSSATPTTDLPTGVLFWRLRGRIGAVAGAAMSATWQVTVGARSAPVSAAYGSTLDLNGDGLADLAAGALLADWTEADTGTVRVYRGSSAGMTLSSGTTLVGPEGGGSYFGESVASAGDVNGDGYSDLIVGAAGNFTTSTGRAHLYLGGASGLADTPSRTLSGPSTFSNFGVAVTGAGDVNGDGYADVVVGAPSATGGGRAYVYHGSASGLSSTVVATLLTPYGLNSRFGETLAGAGDVNADGYGDLLVGAHGASGNNGAFLLYLGSSSGLVATPAFTFVGTEAGARLATAIAFAGDVNGDGYSDAVLGSRSGSGVPGSAYLFFGSTMGFAPVPVTLVGPDEVGGLFGIGVAGAGDVNRDGYSDIAIGASSAGGTGRVYVHLGGPSGVTPVAATVLVGLDPSGSGFGGALSGLDDVNGDGYGDLAVGAGGAMSGRGRLRVYLGDPTGVATTAAVTQTGDGYYGSAIAWWDRCCSTGDREG
jgi:hypothetical protein